MLRSLAMDPHFRYFGFYLAVMVLWLAWAAPGWAVVYASLWLLLAALTLRKRRTARWHELAALCAGLALAMNLAYLTMKSAVPAIRSLRFDRQLEAIDVSLLGTHPDAWLAAHASVWITNALNACYLFFMPLLYFFLLRYFFRRREYLGEFYAGLFLVYGLGFLGYVLVPAYGPYLAHPGDKTFELAGSWITRLNHTMVIKGSNKVDVWPSLHCAVSLYILGFTWRHHRSEFWWLLLPVMGLWLSTLYLGFHYFIDIVCGFALALVALRYSRNYAIADAPHGVTNKELTADAHSNATAG